MQLIGMQVKYMEWGVVGCGFMNDEGILVKHTLEIDIWSDTGRDREVD